MVQRNRFHEKRRKSRTGSAAPPPRAPLTFEKKPLVVYGKPFIVMEDTDKNTFVFSGSAWIAHSMSIAECREQCQVKELPQKVNQMTRYEIRCPV